jgi:hypothetical protein
LLRDFFNVDGAAMSGLFIIAVIGAFMAGGALGFLAHGLCMNAIEPDRL